MPYPKKRTYHRLQFVSAVVAAVGAVYGLSRIIKSVEPPPPEPLPALAPFVAAPPIVPRIDPPLVPQPRAPADDVHEDEADLEAPLLAADADPERVKLLLERGAKEPTLVTAALAGAPNAVGRLLAKHVPANTRSHDGSTPLFAAVTGTITPLGPNRRNIVEKLLAAGADPNDGDGTTTPIAATVARCDSESSDFDGRPVAPPCVAIIKVLVARGAQVDGETLHAAFDVTSGRAFVVAALLGGQRTANATAVALDDAIERQDVELVRAMLEAGAPANHRLPDGRTPLFAAAENGSTTIVTALLDHGARVNERVVDLTALDVAESAGNHAAARVLHARGARRLRVD